MRILALLLVVGAVMSAAEIRGVWIARDSLGSRARIRTTMEALGKANFNVAYVNVWSQGYTLFPSRVFEEETGILIDPQYEGRDVLQEAIEEGKPNGITVVPWFEYGFVGVWSGRLRGGSRGPIFDRHPEGLAKNRAGESEFSIAGGTYYLWMAHTHPEAQEFLIRLMEEAQARYDVPGIQFDRARYPTLECGYDETTRQLYASTHEGQDPPSNAQDVGWVRWRADQLNAFLMRMNARIKGVDWRALVTNAPVPTPDGYRNFAQDAVGWVRDNSHDFLSPQIYWRDLPTYEAKLKLHIEQYGQAHRLVPGIAVDLAKPGELVRIIEATRALGCPGVVIWYYEDIVKANALELLRNTVFAEKASLPWK